MLTYLAACILAVPTAAGWWNADWSCRATVRVDSGFYEREDLVISQPVDFDAWLKKAGVQGAFDPNSPRVIWLRDGKQEEVESRFIPSVETPAKGTLLWRRPGTMAPMVQDRFCIYFDALRDALKPAPKASALQPAGNLVVNGGFEDPDPKDPARPAGWEYKAKDDAGTVEWVHEGAHSGKSCLKIMDDKGDGTSIGARQWVKVLPNRRYLLSGWIRCGAQSESGYGLITAWFSGPERQGVPAKGGGVYGNYKNQNGFKVSPGETPWIRASGTGLNIFDPTLNANISAPGERTMPGTGTASIELSATYGKLSAYFDDIEFKEMIEGEPVEIFVDAVEKN